MRYGRKPTTGATVHSIVHENDEAISFLQRVDALSLEPFKSGSFVRRSRTAGIVWGVRFVLMAMVVAALVLVTGLVYDLAQYGPDGERVLYALVMFIVVTAFSPIIFALGYGGTRLVTGVLPELFFRQRLNYAVSGALKGMAFGRDTDMRIGCISKTSHAFGSNCVLLNGDIAERMRLTAATASNNLLSKYRWTAFQIDPDKSAVSGEFMEDAMTWDSLIHTTYFDQPEVVTLVAELIAADALTPSEAAA